MIGINKDQAFINASLAKLPVKWVKPVTANYIKKQKSQGRKAANISLLDAVDAVAGFRFGVASDDDQLRKFAQDRADQCLRVAGRSRDDNQALKNMVAVANDLGIEAPGGRTVTETGAALRLQDAKWWRRSVRKTAGRNVEGAAIKMGLVSRSAGLYCSDEALKRRSGQRRRNREILEGTNATNDAGQSYTMQALSDLGVSNPKVRRMELMTRIAGFDAIAIQKSHAAEFLTLTAPSKYHAKTAISGQDNKNYAGFTPDQTQAYLCKVFARIRTKLGREGILFYGFRVAEPHHDATPHWHMILFCEVQNVARVLEIFKQYALQEDGNEPGADIHRFKSERIDRKRGSAVGYIAKYISKNIDGQNNDEESIGQDFESGDDATKTAKRVDAWAATWGIRQFQQFGGQSVTTWRELRRTTPDEISGEDLRNIAEKAIAGDWQAYTMLNGGIKEKGRIVELVKQGAEVVEVESINYETGEIISGINKGLNCYGEYLSEKVIGVKGGQEIIKTHLRVWVFERSGAAVSPRSPLNNCTIFYKIGGKITQFKEKAGGVFKIGEKKFVLNRSFHGLKESGPFCTIDLGGLAKYNKEYPLIEGELWKNH